MSEAKVLTFGQETIRNHMSLSAADFLKHPNCEWDRRTASVIDREINALRERAERAEADRDAARKLCEDDISWMHDERCSSCGHRLRFSASHCPQCRAQGVPDWKLPKELPDICECERCQHARAALGRAGA